MTSFSEANKVVISFQKAVGGGSIVCGLISELNVSQKANLVGGLVAVQVPRRGVVVIIIW